MTPKQAPPQPRRVSASLASKAWPDRELCTRCGRYSSRVFGRSESLPIVYLRCDACNRTAVAPA